MDKQEDLTWTTYILPARIEEWSTDYINSNSYMAPELAGICLRGKVYNHPSKQDGSKIRTSRIISVDGKTVYTENTEYILGEPNPEFLKWLKEQGRAFDPINPIKIIK